MPAVREICWDRGEIWISAATSVNTSLYCKVENTDAFHSAELLETMLLLCWASLSSLVVLRECLFAEVAHQGQPWLSVHLIYTSVAMSGWQRLFLGTGDSWDKAGFKSLIKWMMCWHSLCPPWRPGTHWTWRILSKYIFFSSSEGNRFCISVLEMPEFFRQFNMGKIDFVISLICFAVLPTHISLTAFWSMDRNSDIQRMHQGCCCLGMHEDSYCPFTTFL